MLRLIGIVISIGLADSLNPTTLAPALVLATGEHGSGRHEVGRFLLGVFGVYLLGGLLIALGAGELVLDIVPKPGPRTGQILEVIAGAVLLVAGGLLWRHRATLAEKQLLTAGSSRNRPGLILGATITAFELPTAFPYFAAIAAVVGSGQSILHQVLLLVLYNVCFVAPILGIYATLALAGDRAEAYLARARAVLQKHWPLVLALVALLAGAFTIFLGVTGVVSHVHGRFGGFARKLHKLLPH
jgi:cytochrome c biogenesis protein CcdA